MQLGFLFKNAVKSVLPWAFAAGTWWLWLGNRVEDKSLGFHSGEKGRCAGPVSWCRWVIREVNWGGSRSYITISAHAWDLHVSCIMGMGTLVCVTVQHVSPSLQDQAEQSLVLGCCTSVCLVWKLCSVPLQDKATSLGSKFDSLIFALRSCDWLPHIQQRRERSCVNPS